MLSNMEEIFKTEAPGDQRNQPVSVGLSEHTIESMAQAEKARVAAILADQAKAEAIQDIQGGPGLVLRGQNSSANQTEKADQPEKPETATEEKAEGNDNSGQGASEDKKPEIENENKPVSEENTGDGGNIPSLEEKGVSTPRPGEESESGIESKTEGEENGAKLPQKDPPTTFKGSMSLKAATCELHTPFQRLLTQKDSLHCPILNHVSPW